MWGAYVHQLKDRGHHSGFKKQKKTKNPDTTTCFL